MLRMPYRYERGWQEYHGEEGDGFHDGVVRTSEHVVGLDHPVSRVNDMPLVGSWIKDLAYQGDFSFEPLLCSLCPPSYTLDHLLLERQVFFCLGPIFQVKMPVRKHLKNALLPIDNVFQRFESDRFNFHNMASMPKQIVEPFKIRSLITVLQRVSCEFVKYG